MEQFNSQWIPVENSIELALYNVSDDSFIKRIRNTSLGYCGPSRPIDNQYLLMKTVICTSIVSALLDTFQAWMLV